MAMARLYLQLLGGFEAHDAQGLPVSFLTRKAEGLVAYLALPAGRFHSREKLAGLLWGRSADEQARSSLRQTLSGLRRELAEHDADVLVCRGESLALDASVVDSDVSRLEAAVAVASPAGAAQTDELYNGELLEGFGLHEEAFEEWLEEERRRLREAAVQAMSKELDHCLSSEAVERGIAVAGRHHVRSVKYTNEGYLLAFDGPERAVRCAAAIGRRLEDCGLRIRAGVYVGECEAHGDELNGLF